MKDDELIEKLRNCANGIGSLKSDKGDYGICDDAADAIEALTAEVERLKLDLQAKDCLQDSAYQAGMKHGWNCAVSGDRDAYDTAISSEHIAELRRVNEARAALQPQEKVGYSRL